MDDGDRPLRADLLAGMGQAPLAAVGDMEALLRADVAGELDDIDQRRIVVFLRNRAFHDAVRNQRMLVHRTQRQPNRQIADVPR